jgi:mRNA-degrading endonuclease RelE of RelBE toxin-antitoxin system
MVGLRLRFSANLQKPDLRGLLDGYTGFQYIYPMLLTVIEHPLFQRQVSKIWSDEEREDFIVFIAGNPEAGKIVKKTSPAVRKVRGSREGMGKSGGVRVLYYYLDEDEAVLLVTIYVKGKVDALTAAQINRLTKG